MTELPDTRGWAASLVAIAELIGERAAKRLADDYGGVELYIPRKMRPDHPLAQAIGVDAARVLAQEYGGEKIHPPVLGATRALKRQIAEADGSLTEIARRFGVTRRWVSQVRAGPRIDRRQGTLPID